MYKHASRNHLFDEVIMWKIHDRSSHTGIDYIVIAGAHKHHKVLCGTYELLVIDLAIYSDKKGALDDFPFVMAIHTGQFVFSGINLRHGGQDSRMVHDQCSVLFVGSIYVLCVMFSISDWYVSIGMSCNFVCVLFFSRCSTWNVASEIW